MQIYLQTEYVHSITHKNTRVIGKVIDGETYDLHWTMPTNVSLHCHYSAAIWQKLANNCYLIVVCILHDCCKLSNKVSR